ncbi:Nramp family divalent metal transporter [Alteromonas facilis]|uniref:Nramp family divalent metal transporter n=1 Tax=Alteromonas facilis TaxID=2048004 RepID=UPI000C2952A8|nr:Nramp family divalent metal transporter [Alteromonas facilis]
MHNSTSSSPPSNRYAAWLVAAAFIGPGTVTTASIAGAEFGFHVLWALLFSVFATLVLQDMTVRLGVVTRLGLADAIHAIFTQKAFRYVTCGLIIAAIGIGNAAYEGGNLTGAALGLSQLSNVELQTWVMILGVISAAILWFGHAGLIEKVLVALVGLMSVIFIITVVAAKPDWSALLAAAAAPRFDASTFTIVLALIGTTIVPYNLFLHASLVRQYDRPTDIELHAQRRTTLFAVLTGGVITLAIMTTATAAFYQTGKSLDAGNIASQLTPLLGEAAGSVFAVGLFAAGLTSAITAPLAAGYAVCGALKLSTERNSAAFRGVWLSVLCLGAITATFGIKPLVVMLFAQATNGLLLPFIAVFLLIVMNNKSHLGDYRNSIGMNILGAGIVCMTLFLGLRKLMGVF